MAADMSRRFEVRPRRRFAGVFPAPISEHAEEVRALIAEHPEAEVRPTVALDNPCVEHPAYEADYCPRCGLSGTDVTS
jgi:hypothetical protein